MRLILPLGLPAIASLAIFQFLWTWNDLLVALVLRPQHAADHGRDLPAARAQFGSNIELIAPASFMSLVIPLVVFFAFQRYFVQGLLAGSVNDRRRRRDRRRRARAASPPTRRCGTAGSSRTRSRSSAPTPTRPRRGGARAAAIRQRRMRSESDGHCLPTSFPGLAVHEALAPAQPRPAAAQRLRPLPPVGRRLPRARRASCARARLGREPAARAHRAGARGRRRLRARRARRFRHVLARARAIQGSQSRRSSRTTRAPSTRTSRTSTRDG